MYQHFVNNGILSGLWPKFLYPRLWWRSIILCAHITVQLRSDAVWLCSAARWLSGLCIIVRTANWRAASTPQCRIAYIFLQCLYTIKDNDTKKKKKTFRGKILRVCNYTQSHKRIYKRNRIEFIFRFVLRSRSGTGNDKSDSNFSWIKYTREQEGKTCKIAYSVFNQRNSLVYCK